MKEREHWAVDEDLLREYVLGKITGRPRADMKHHLDSCSACRQLVDEEETFALGVRRHAMLEEKMQLQALIGRSNSPIPWPRIMSIAALLVIIAGIGIYNRWFFRMNDEPRLIDERDWKQDAPAGSPETEVDPDVKLEEWGESSTTPVTSAPLESPSESSMALTQEPDQDAATESSEYVVVASRLSSNREDPVLAPLDRAEGLRRDNNAVTGKMEPMQRFAVADRIVVIHRLAREDSTETGDSLTVMLRISHDTLHVTIPVSNPAHQILAVVAGDTLRIRSGPFYWWLQIPESLRRKTENSGAKKP